jgi:hypothetical protein
LIPNFEESLHRRHRDQNEHKHHRPKEKRVKKQTYAKQNYSLCSLHQATLGV